MRHKELVGEVYADLKQFILARPATAKCGIVYCHKKTTWYAALYPHLCAAADRVAATSSPRNCKRTA